MKVKTSCLRGQFLRLNASWRSCPNDVGHSCGVLPAAKDGKEIAGYTDRDTVWQWREELQSSKCLG